VLESGDVRARTLIRVEETRESARLIRQVAQKLPGGPLLAEMAPLPAFRPAFGLVEGWRGRIVHWVMANGEGKLERVKILDPSFLNWRPLSYALQDRLWPHPCPPFVPWPSALASTSPGGLETQPCSGWSRLISRSSSGFTLNDSLGLMFCYGPSSSASSGIFSPADLSNIGFARLRCPDCGSERLTLSREQRGVCPSCDAKRAAAFAAFLKDELLEKRWPFLVDTIPKMVRSTFMHHRELLGDLSRLAYQTIQELMIEAVGDPKARPGAVAVPQTFGSLLNPHPHIHRLPRWERILIPWTEGREVVL
jgi:hypothetical protein